MKLSSEKQIDRIEQQLGKPSHRGESCPSTRVIVCNIWIGSKTTIDLTITSPPYNIGKEYRSIRDLPDYLDWCEAKFCQKSIELLASEEHSGSI